MGRERRRRKDIKTAVKTLVVSEPIAIFHPGDGKS